MPRARYFSGLEHSTVLRRRRDRAVRSPVYFKTAILLAVVCFVPPARCDTAAPTGNTPPPTAKVSSGSTKSPTPFSCAAIKSCPRCTGSEGCGICINGKTSYSCVPGNETHAHGRANCKMYYYSKCSGPQMSCPIGCSGHGKCTPDGCSCDSGFAGGDCSDDEETLSEAPIIVVGLVIGAAIFVVAVIVSVQVYGQRCMSKGRSRFRYARAPASSPTTLEEERELCSYEHPQSPPPDPWDSAAAAADKSRATRSKNKSRSGKNRNRIRTKETVQYLL